MRKIVQTLCFLAFLVAGVSCNKEIPGPAGNEMPGNNGLNTVTFRIKLDGEDLSTKAYTINASNDATINTLDVYEFRSWTSRPAEHYSLSAAEIAAGEFMLQKPSDKTYRYLVVANGGPLALAKMEELAPPGSIYVGPTYHRLAEAFGGATGIPMGAILEVSYASEHSEEINLYRYMYRVDVGSITVDFDNDLWMHKDVFVKRIALANVFQAFYYYSWMGDNGTLDPTLCLFGQKVAYNSSKPFIGGEETEMFKGMGETSGYDANYYLYAESGSGTESFNICLNNNYKKAEGVLNITATGNLLEATVQTYDNANGQGRVCSSTNSNQSHTLTVNKSFYAIPGTSTGGTYGIVQTYSNQNSYPKLVIELDVNGTTCFYPIQMYYPQPNTVYNISQITLKGSGSPYSNFIEEKNQVDFSLDVEPWTTVDIDNINIYD